MGGLEPALDHVPYAVRSATNPTTLEEIDEIVPDVYESSDDEAEDEDESTTAAVGQKKKKSVKGKEKEEPKAKKLAPGMARIIRDENGNVLKIVVGNEDGEEVEEDVVAPNRGGEESEDEDSEEEEEAEAKPWGEAMKDWDVGQDRFVDEDEEMEDEERDPRKFKQGIPIEGALKRVTAKTDVVRGQFETLTSTSALLSVLSISLSIDSTRGTSSEQDQGDPTHIGIRKGLARRTRREVR